MRFETLPACSLVLHLIEKTIAARSVIVIMIISYLLNRKGKVVPISITLSRAFLVILITGGFSLITWIALFLVSIDTYANSIYADYTIPIHVIILALVVIARSIIEPNNTF